MNNRFSFAKAMKNKCFSSMLCIIALALVPSCTKKQPKQQASRTVREKHIITITERGDDVFAEDEDVPDDLVKF
jgi:hypothetical protein